MAKDNKSTGRGAAPNRAGRPTGSYSSYGTSGYGYGANGGGSYGRSPYGSYGAQQPNANGANNAPAQNNKKAEKEKGSDKDLKGKQKKLAKRAKKFDETDLRCYPMTVGGWIGTFILSCLIPINIIFFICWFFGVGNKSRTAWVRAYVVVSIIIVLLMVMMFGIFILLVNKNVAGLQEPVYSMGETVVSAVGGLAVQYLHMSEDKINDMLNAWAKVCGVKDKGTNQGGNPEGGATVSGEPETTGSGNLETQFA